MEFLNMFLPVVLYVVAIILLVIFIIVGLKLITILDKVDNIVDDVDKKVSSLDTAFTVLTKTVNGIANISDSLLFGITTKISKILKNKGKEVSHNE